MNQYIKTDPWKIIEESFSRERMRSSESLFSIGNGIMGQRANFEETYSGDTLQGSYVGGVYYPDKTRVGWWKNGYPEYFAKVLNSAFWIGIKVEVNGQEVDLAVNAIRSYHHELDMREGVLRRQVRVQLGDGTLVDIYAERFLSLVRTQLGAIKYSVTPVDRSAEITFSPYIDADVYNQDSNYDEKFWEYVSGGNRHVQMRTLKTGFEVCWNMRNSLMGSDFENTSQGEYVSQKATGTAAAGETVTLYKYVGITSTLNHEAAKLAEAAELVADEAAAAGYEALLKEHADAWEAKWRQCDIEITGDDEAQQGIRYCIFMLLQTYTGVDSRLNIGPKGFTGEKYGGSTYWDTEAYCLPFYLSTSGREVAKQLLVYRYNQLDRAIENGEKLGFKDGAALYPMVTMNGEECHNEWEITFEEIHRNGAIAYAIYNYVRYTGDESYLSEYGLEVLMGIARFWAQRITFSEERGKYVMLGVTGPNEYENNVNNNWYTNYIACWCMRYAAEAAEKVKSTWPEEWARIIEKRSFDYETETGKWKDIYTNMHLPEKPELGIFLQQDGYMDKEQILVRDLDPADRPLNQKWSWDRILRSCFIKQADVLQGLYFFEDDFDTQTIARNFKFYEERTVHESSLSPCVHSILAAKIGDMGKAYEMYLRTARLDLDDYNKEIEDGLHITSMAGSWLSVIEGFAGMRVRDGKLHLKPVLPEGWNSLAFRIDFRDQIVNINISRGGITIQCPNPAGGIVEIGGKEYELSSTPQQVEF